MSEVFYKNGVVQINDERHRQITLEGYNDEHDEKHKDGELAFAAIAYICFYGAHTYMDYTADEALEEALEFWPWESDDPNDLMKPEEDPIRNLVKAGALIAAEIDRLLKIKGQTE